MFKNKISSMLSDEQKATVVNQIKNMNQQELMGKLKNLNISEAEFMNMMNNLDNNTVSKKIDDLKRRR